MSSRQKPKVKKKTHPNNQANRNVKRRQEPQTGEGHQHAKEEETDTQTLDWEGAKMTDSRIQGTKRCK